MIFFDDIRLYPQLLCKCLKVIRLKASTALTLGGFGAFFLLWLMHTTFNVFDILRFLAEQTGLPFWLQVVIVFFGVWFFVSYVLRSLPFGQD